MLDPSRYIDVTVTHLSQGESMKGARDMPAVNLRMPREVKDWLESEAQKNFRSLTSEILCRLVAAKNEKTPTGMLGS
ncbi:Arc family DNA-binding protein [Robbsia andropogonis]|uniref:Arc family DNA-binding protein n=1 Tax=Robbsia andropogonis TaxID=28092 RepID=UPI003D1B4C81